MDPVASPANGIDLGRLEAAVRDLSDRFLAQRDENLKLRGEIEGRDRRLEEVEAELRRMQQSRREIAQRIDDLIDQISQLEARLSSQPETP